MPSLISGPMHYGDLRFEGGWRCDTPQIEVVRDDATFRRLVTAFQRWGNRPLKAEDLAREACVGVFEARWLTNVRAFVARAAKEHLRRGGEMDTFKPEEVARAYVPGLDDLLSPGRKNLFLEEALRGMRG